MTDAPGSAEAHSLDASPRRSPSRFGAARWGALVLVVTLCLGAALIVRHRLAPKHFEVVEPGMLYRSATLRPDRLLSVVEAHSIRTVVNLRSLEENREPWYEAQRTALAGTGVAMIDLPMDRATTPDAMVDAAWRALLDNTEARPILVHCQYGVLRTGIMVSAYDVLYRGADPAGLYERGPQFGHDVSSEVRARIQTYLSGLAVTPVVTRDASSWAGS